MSKPRSALRDAVEYWLIRFLLATLAIGPRAFSELLARAYTELLDFAVPRLRAVALRNLQMALPHADHDRIVDEMYRSIARLLVAVARFPQITRGNIGGWIRYEGYEHFERALARGKGVLFATAHLGNWELSAFAHAWMSAPMHIVVRPLDNPRLNAFAAARRALSGNRLIEKQDYARAILAALDRNEAVGVLLDQNASLDTGVFVDFFGIRACASAGFARIAAHSGAAVIPGFALWSGQERRYVLRFYAPIEMTGDVARDTQAIHAHLEGVIREHPGQWLWIHRRWKTRPPGEPPLY
ncbi:MAG: lysophospholipid acyltransferase family protein [Bryobacteraceae bacterium]